MSAESYLLAWWDNDNGLALAPSDDPLSRHLSVSDVYLADATVITPQETLEGANPP